MNLTRVRYPVPRPLCNECDAEADWWLESSDPTSAIGLFVLTTNTPYCNEHCPPAPLKGIG